MGGLAALAAVMAGPAVPADASYSLITILHTNDLHGRVMPPAEEGGLARAATIVRQVREEMPNVLLLDAGDIIHGTPEDYLSGGVATITAMNAAGYAAATTGNHEYDFGLETVGRVESTARFALLAANIRAASGGQFGRIVPWEVFTIDGVRIGVLGLATLDTITLHWPESIRDLRIDDPLETARRAVPELRKQCDVLVVLSHLGAVPDQALAREVGGIDFIIGGHSHTTIPEWMWIGDTLITQTGAYGRALGRIDFIVEKSPEGARVASVNGKVSAWNDPPWTPLSKRYPEGPLIRVTNDVPYDPDVERAYRPFRKQAEKALSAVIGTATEAVPGGKGETPAANLVADAVRKLAGSDIAVIDSASVTAAGLPQGDVTAGHAFGLIGGYTRQEIVIGRMSGETLRLALDAEFRRKQVVALAFSGMALEYEMADGSPRSVNISVAGQWLDAQRNYTVAAQAYVMMNLMEAASGRVSITGEPKATTREAARDYIRGQKAVSAPETGRARLIQGG